jgi:hypothetical protein
MRAFNSISITILSSLTLLGSGCGKDREDRYETPKPVEVEVRRDGDFVKVRERDTSELRTRLARLDDRIAQLRAKGDEASSKLADDLRVRRDELAVRLDRAGEETETRWDGFKRDVSDAFDKLEREIDDALD